VHDGPGIRTSVFFKGCPLHCQWCHNPEGISGSPQGFKRKRQLDGKKWIHEEIIGKTWSSAEVFEVIMKDLVFYEESIGGVTFSGGEPMMQPAFLLELLALCRDAGIHAAVDTSGYADRETFLEIARNTQMILFDLKTMDNEKHKTCTGVGNETILSNLKSLSAPGPELIIRIPVIPGVNNMPDDITAIKDLLLKLNIPVKQVNLLPYHRLGRRKYQALGLDDPPVFQPEITTAGINRFLEIFSNAGIEVKQGG
jgi:pyruvate formate lyase activating enzyme